MTNGLACQEHLQTCISCPVFVPELFSNAAGQSKSHRSFVLHQSKEGTTATEIYRELSDAPGRANVSHPEGLIHCGFEQSVAYRLLENGARLRDLDVAHGLCAKSFSFAVDFHVYLFASLGKLYSMFRQTITIGSSLGLSRL
jgi:hypothetical protein